jgi:hypothetical protein
VILAALEVETVGGEPEWLHILLAAGGPILIATAAVIAAFVAAKTANTRQREQLAHDLLKRRVDDVRSTLDAAAELALASATVLVDFELAVENWEEESAAIKTEGANPGLTPDDRAALMVKAAAAKDGFLAANRALTETLIEMMGTKVRLQLRLGSGHPIPDLYERLRIEYRRHGDFFSKGVAGGRTDAERKEEEDHQAVRDEVFEGFFSACEEWLASAPTFA